MLDVRFAFRGEVDLSRQLGRAEASGLSQAIDPPSRGREGLMIRGLGDGGSKVSQNDLLLNLEDLCISLLHWV